MNVGDALLLLSIFFGALSLFSLLSNELKLKKGYVQQIIPHAKSFISLSAIFITLSIALLTYYLIVSDFSLLYVWQYTSNDLPLIYKISALWTGEAGSLMFLAWCLMILAFHFSLKKSQDSEFEQRIQIIILVTGLLFLVLTIPGSPFAKVPGSDIPDDGAGLNPLLVNKWMIFHPPGVFISYALITVIFACAVAFLIYGSEKWERFSRNYARAAWIILGAGMAAGVVWSYEVWENYWIWDIAFTSMLMTWLLLTAYLHCADTHRKNGMKFLTPALAVNVFISAMYSTYIIRSGTINSAHSFAESSNNPALLLAVILVAILSESLLIYRYNSSRPALRNSSSKIITKQNHSYAMVIVLAGLAFILFWGLTASLLLSNFGASISVNLYGTWSYPLTIVLIAGLGICMFDLPEKFLTKAVLLYAIFIVLVLVIRPSQNILTGLSGTLLAFAGAGTIYRIMRVINVSGIRNKLFLSAPHVVHLGIVIMLTGVLLSSLGTQETLLFMKLNEKKTIGGYEIQLNELAFPEYNEHASAVMTKVGKYNIYKENALLASGEASFKEVRGELITRPFIYSGAFSDVYITYQGVGSQSPLFVSVASVRIIPGMKILWLGCILVLTGLIPILASGIFVWKSLYHYRQKYIS